MDTRLHGYDVEGGGYDKGDRYDERDKYDEKRVDTSIPRKYRFLQKRLRSCGYDKNVISELLRMLSARE
jgi:hypothetical protein